MISPSYYIAMSSQPWEDDELMLKSLLALTYKWDSKVIIYFLWIKLLLMKVSDNKYTQDRHHDISWVWDSMFP